MLKQTKIVASISDLRCDVDFISALFEAGMNVVRNGGYSCCATVEDSGFECS